MGSVHGYNNIVGLGPGIRIIIMVTKRISSSRTHRISHGL
jgi:hypothetical protein